MLNKINWKLKLSSRKFWALIAGVATSLIVGINLMAGGSPESVTTMVGAVSTIIGSVGSVAVYVLAEAKVDANRTK